MQVVGFVIGVISVVGMFIFFLPLLGALNWLNVPLAIVGLIISLISISSAKDKGIGLTGAILCGIAIFVGIGRLRIGCGIF
ncbi:MAG: hypothetical protein HW414_1280 [Dehalococcoidia bacterium]|nr:hypothetical protein [Dehalococcoidia bacterium]